MEVRPVFVDHKSSPVTGTALWIVIDEGHKYVQLLHPVYLQRLEITVEEFRRGIRYDQQGTAQVYWPENNTNEIFHADALAIKLEDRMREMARRQRQFPQQLVRRVIAGLRGVAVDKVALIKEPSASPRGFAIPSEKRPGVINALTDQLYKGGTFDELFAALAKQFPDRGEGMKTTIRCQLQRLPKKLGIKLEVTDVKKRGKVYRFLA